MKIELIQTKHIAKCIAENSDPPPTNKTSLAFFQPSTSSSPTKKKLPTLAYSLYSENKLRSILRDLGISSKGNKKMLERRHTEWMTLWNANADSKSPVSKSVLLSRLLQWESSMEKLKDQENRKQDLKNLDSDEWLKNHSDSFNSLLEQAKKSRKGATSNDEEVNEIRSDANEVPNDASEGIST